jgi:hypothetical protein
MPKAKKRKVSPNPENMVLSKKKRSKGKAKCKQNLTPDAQRSHPDGDIVYEQPVYRTFNDRDRKDPSPSDQTGLSVDGHPKSSKTPSQIHGNGKQTHPNRPPEIQELRGWPDAVTSYSQKLQTHE